ncbi:MAG: TMEM175 family protein [Chloroflexota bacterium]|nr:TMEM175 family protein [Chloroflexota bacterium]
MTATGSGQHGGAERHTSLDRLLTLTDGVFAIAITLLALTLEIPEGAERASRGALLQLLLATWPQVYAFGQSFAILALFWVAHHRLFGYIRRSDGVLLWLNLMLLLTITFIPFPTSLAREHLQDPVAMAFYFGNLLATSLVYYAIWLYATSNRRLVAPDLSTRLIRHYRVHTALPVLLFLAFTLWGVGTAIVPVSGIVLTAATAVAYLLAAGYVVLSMQDYWEPK